MIDVESSIRSWKRRSMTIVTIGAMLRTTMIAPMDAWSRASIDDASISVKRKGIVSDQRSTSRTEPKCSPHGTTTRQTTVKAIWIITSCAHGGGRHTEGVHVQSSVLRAVSGGEKMRRCGTAP